jgi:hypothetical protein
MARHIWSVLCSRAIVDQDNNISLIGVTESMGFQALEEVPPGSVARIPVQLTLVSLWTRAAPDTAERIRVRISVVLPGGRRVGSGTEMAVDLENYPRTRTFMNFQDLPILPGVDTYEFQVESFSNDQWRLEASVPVEFRLVPFAGAEAPQPPKTRALNIAG